MEFQPSNHRARGGELLRPALRGQYARTNHHSRHQRRKSSRLSIAITFSLSRRNSGACRGRRRNAGLLLGAAIAGHAGDTGKCWRASRASTAKHPLQHPHNCDSFRLLSILSAGGSNAFSSPGPKQAPMLRLLGWSSVGNWSRRISCLLLAVCG